MQQFPLRYGLLTDTGRVRQGKPNEDCVHAFEGVSKSNQPFYVFVVADGMGGHDNGQAASQLAVTSLTQFLTATLERSEIPDENIGTAVLKAAVRSANNDLCVWNAQRVKKSGTTINVVMIVEATAYIANVGDSRTYLWRWMEQPHLTQLTKDHSLVETNTITQEESYTHPERNKIYRSLGDKLTLEVDVFVKPLEANDRILLCSDGLWGMVRDAQIDRVLHGAPTPERACQQLVEAANTNGGEDNISAIVVQVYPPAGVAPNLRAKAQVEEIKRVLVPQLASTMRQLGLPIAACLHVLCIGVGFLVLTGLPVLFSLMSSAYACVCDQKEDENAPGYILQLGSDGQPTISYLFEAPPAHDEGRSDANIWTWTLC